MPLAALETLGPSQIQVSSELPGSHAAIFFTDARALSFAHEALMHETTNA